MRKRFEIKIVRLLLTLSLAALAITAPGRAEPPQPASVSEVDSEWPGVKMQVIEVDRLAGNKLLFVVRLVAAANAPAGTLLGIPQVFAPDVTEEERKNASGPTPFSLKGSTMTDEQTQQKSAMLPPEQIVPGYRPDSVLMTLRPKQNWILAVQFLAPTPPAADDKGIVPKQTVSLLLPKANGPITKIVIPPPAP
jgi:hypothetical protein